MNGNPGKRPLPEPIPVPRGRPPCPRHLKKEARKQWKHACDMLAYMGVLSKADAVAIEMFCDTWALYREACEKVALFGTVQCLDKEKRTFALNPYFRVRNRLMDQLHKLMTEFGFTPAARARIVRTGNAETEDDPLIQLMKIS